jgi:hypothetical protein
MDRDRVSRPQRVAAESGDGAQTQEEGLLASIYRGPLLLAYDTHHQEADWEPLPVLDPVLMELRQVQDTRWLKPWLPLETTAIDGSTLRLCDFASAGMVGTVYESWLPIKLQPVPAHFSATNPLRSQRPQA